MSALARKLHVHYPEQTPGNERPRFRIKLASVDQVSMLMGASKEARERRRDEMFRSDINLLLWRRERELDSRTSLAWLSTQQISAN